MKTKKMIIILVIIITLVISMVGVWFFCLKPCKHQWMDATCETPVICEKCEETAGNALGHEWKEPNCTEPKTCSKCKEIKGDALGHMWEEANCTVPKSCTVCKTTEGEALGHQWKEATYSAPKTCEICGITEGVALTRPSTMPNNSSGNDGSSNDIETTVKKCLLCSATPNREETPYCSSHDCTITSCPYPAKNVGSTWGSYCEFHGCRYPGCLHNPIGGINYCISHKD